MVVSIVVKCECLFNGDSKLFQVNVATAIANHQLITAWHYAHCVGLLVPVLEIFVLERDFHSGRLTGFQTDALEGTQRLERSIGIVEAAHIHLNHLITIVFAIIGNIHADDAMKGIEARLANGKGCVAQSVTEWEKRLILKVSVCAVCHAIFLKVWQLISAAIECQR